jgi:tetratricopeptide (TPR) repeat protein
MLDRFGVTPSRGPTAVRGTMSTEVGRLLGGHDAALVAEVTHLLGHVAGVPFPDSPILRGLEGDPRRLQARTGHALRTFLVADARKEGPLLLVLDKFNLASREAVALLAELCAKPEHVPLCVVVVGRPPVAEMVEGTGSPTSEARRGGAGTAERVGASAGEGWARPPTVLRLGAFSEAEAHAYLQALLVRLPVVPEELVAAAWHRSEGNPVSLRALARVCLDAGVIDTDGAPWTVHLERLRDGSLPVSMEDAHRARIARLSAEERRALDRASVFGEVFWEEAILALTRADRLDDRDLGETARPDGDRADAADGSWQDDLDARDLHDLLRRLEAMEFATVFEEGEFPHTVEYVFRHAGMKALLYGELDDDRRRGYHLRAAQWLENAAGPRREQYLAAIGQHYESGGEPRKAAFAFLYAASLARNSFHNDHAIALYGKGLALVAPEDRNARVEAHHDLGSVYFLVGDYDAAEEQFRKMLEAAWVLCHRGKAGAALNRIGRVHRARGDIRAARECLERALVLFRSVEDTRGVASTLDDLGSLAGLEGDYEAALARSAEALELRRSLNDRRGTAVSLHTIGTIEMLRGLLTEAEACFLEALLIRREIDDAEGVASSLNALGVLHGERALHERALEFWREAIEVARTVGSRRIIATILNNMGETRLAMGEPAEAARLLDDAAAIAEDLEDKRLITETRRNLGRVYLKNNDLERARAELERALQVAEELGGKHVIGLAILALAELHSMTVFDASTAAPSTVGRAALDEDAADVTLDETVPLAAPTEAAPEPPAERLFRRALAIFEDIGNETETAKCLSSYGTYLLERGDSSRGKPLLERAAALLRRLGSRASDRVEQTIQEI